MKRFYSKRIPGLIILAVVMFMSVLGCGQSNEPSLSNEAEWELGYQQLPAQIGMEQQENDFLATITNESLSQNSKKIAEMANIEAPTGKWFMHEGEGVFAYSLPSGVKKAGDEFNVSLIAHETNGVELNRDIQIQLATLTEDFEQEELIVNEIIEVGDVSETERLYSGHLPEEENSIYLLRVEILNAAGEVEDSRLSIIYVPRPEINAAISMNKESYQSTDEAKLTLENFGPTLLSLTMHYTIEKKIDGTWRKVPLDLAFIEIAITLGVGQKHEQGVNLSELSAGHYRVIKTIRAHEFNDLDAILAAEFNVETKE